MLLQNLHWQWRSLSALLPAPSPQKNSQGQFSRALAIWSSPFQQNQNSPSVTLIRDFCSPTPSIIRRPFVHFVPSPCSTPIAQWVSGASPTPTDHTSTDR